MGSQVSVLVLPGPLRTPALRCGWARRVPGLEHRAARPPTDSAGPVPHGGRVECASHRLRCPSGHCAHRLSSHAADAERWAAWLRGDPAPHPKGTNACLVASTQLRVSRMAVSVPRRRLEASSVPATDPFGGRGRHRGPRPEHGLGPHLPGPGGRHVPFQVPELYNRDSVPPHSAQLQRGPPQGQAQAPGRAWQSGAHGAGPRGPRRPGLQSLSVLSSEHGCAHFTRSHRSPSGTPGRLLDLPPATGWARADAWTAFQLRVGEVFTRFLGSFAVRPPPGFSTQQRSA